MKNEKKLHWFSYDKNKANLETFCWDKNFSKNLLFLRSAVVLHTKYSCLYYTTCFYVWPSRKLNFERIMLLQTQNDIVKSYLNVRQLDYLLGTSLMKAC